IAGNPQSSEVAEDASSGELLAHSPLSHPRNPTPIATSTGNGKTPSVVPARLILLDHPLYTVDNIRSSLQVIFALPRREPIPSVVKETRSLSRAKPREIIIGVLDRN